MMTRYQKLEIDPFQILQSMIVALDDEVLSLLAAVDIEHLVTFCRQGPQPVLSRALKQSNQRHSLLLRVFLGELKRLGLNYFLKSRIECQCWNDGCFDRQTKQPKRRLCEAKDAECHDSQHVDWHAAEARDVNADQERRLEIAPH